MRHFVGYHNPKRMGYSAFTDADPFCLYTSKPIGDLVGDVVWVVTGEGKGAKTYYLSSWFVIDEVGESDDSDFGFVLRGKHGGMLDPVPVLNDEEWFPEFRQRMANFSLGFQEVRQSEVIDTLRQLAAQGNCPQTL